jgi:RNA polymerase sigma factor (TIGR02999 family)
MSTETLPVTDLWVTLLKMIAEPEPFESLLGQLYPELRTIAGSLARGERRSHTLQRTALIHEAFLRLSKNFREVALSREQFLALVGHEMRMLLIDHARKHHAQRRGGEFIRVPLFEHSTLADRYDDDVLGLDEALTRLAKIHPRSVSVVELKFFAGFTTAEIAAILAISVATVESDWAYAKAWLYREFTKKRWAG